MCTAARAKVHFQSVQRLEASDSVGEMTNQAFDWIFHRCFNPVPPGIAACVGRGDANPPILQFDPSGKLLKRPEPRSVVGVLLVLRDDVVPGFAHDFSSTIDGMFANPHGFTLDNEVRAVIKTGGKRHGRAQPDAITSCASRSTKKTRSASFAIRTFPSPTIRQNTTGA
jgi:hypothetical protein